MIKRFIEFLKGSKKTQKVLPPGFYVQSAHQNPLHMLWEMCIVSFDDICDDNIEVPRCYLSTDCDTYNEALQVCISKIELYNNEQKPNTNQLKIKK